MTTTNHFRIPAVNAHHIPHISYAGHRQIPDTFIFISPPQIHLENITGSAL